MKFKYLLFVLFFGSGFVAQAQVFPCDCEVTDTTSFVCAQDSLGNIFHLPNLCFVECLGLTPANIPCDDAPDPWGGCVCPQIYDPVCALDSLGNYFELPNACYAECLGFSIVTDSTLCNIVNPWDCDCPILTDSTYVCAQDSLGNIYPVPSACWAVCWGMTVVDSTECDNNPWDECNCPTDYNPVCVQDSLGNIFSMSNACYAECYGFTIVDSTDCGIINPVCECAYSEFDTFICATDSLGNIFQVPNACFAACWGYTVVDSTDCGYVDPWSDCECDVNENEPFVCAQDSLGHACYVPNACYAACLGLTIVSDSSCNYVEIDPEIDSLTLTCLQNIDLPESGLFQEFLLAISQSCNLVLPACIVNAPIFASDSLFFDYIMTNCDGNFGFNGNNDGSNIMNMYNFANAALSSSKDITINKGFDIKVTENPVTNLLRYQINTVKDANITAKIVNINGQTIHAENLKINAGNNEFNTNISGMKSGIYLLNITGANINKTVKLVIAE
ncbi:MAG: T9SS type A sorting domain-containing protein [Saprospiraceae bacterium]|nr:T9SS type A sorting domain-containing protein [Saprospiraceae bacterium]